MPYCKRARARFRLRWIRRIRTAGIMKGDSESIHMRRKTDRAATGERRLSKQKLNEREFWSIGADTPVSDEVLDVAASAVSEGRGERGAGLLGRQGVAENRRPDRLLK